MKHNLSLLVIGCIALIPVGCGKSNDLLRTKGQVVKNGKPFAPEKDENLQIALIPISPDGKPPRNWYAAEVDPATGSFYAAGGEKKGVPQGKYRVMVELKKKKKDVLGGKFDALKSPFIVDIDQKSSPIMIDIENPPKT